MIEPSAKLCAHHARNFPDEPATRPIGEFGKNRRFADGYRYECRRCTNIAQNARRAALAASRPADPPKPPPDPLTVALEAHREAKDRRDLKREHAALVEENERLRERNAQLVRLSRPPEILVYREAKDVRADAVACALGSDWHVEEEVEAASVHGLNAYNLEIAKARSERFFRNVLRLANMAARDSTIRKLYFGILGDLFSGHIHDELKASTLLAPGDAARFVIGLISSGIDFLLRESEFEIEGDMIPGNHGRMTDRVWHSDPTGTSLETMAYHAIANRYEGNPRVRLKVAEHAMVYRKFFERFTMRAIHGYEIKFGGGVGGITIPIRKALAQWNVPIRADLTVMGHFHQRHDGGDFLVNGSLIGYNTFAQAIKATFQPAEQTFFLIHARNGGEKSLVAPVWLDEARKV